MSDSILMGFSESRWEDIYKQLKNDGFDVYSPGQKKGECQKSYVVIKNSGLSEVVGISTNSVLYDVMCYVPSNNYSMLEPFTDKVKLSMDKLFPLIRPTHFQTSSFFDDSVKAHMISIQYQNYQKKVRA